MKTIKSIFALLIIASFSVNCTHDDVVDIVDPTDPNAEAYENARHSFGGMMYDKFWSEESGFDQNNQYLTTINDFANFFRCKQCHAWDGLGNAGSYISRAPKLTRPNVASVNLYQISQMESPEELFEELKKSTGRRDISYDLSLYDPDSNKTEGDKMPNLNQIFTDAQLWDIVKFLKEGMFDVEELYEATYTGTYPAGSATFTNIGLNGNAANGNDFFSTNCAVCHGVDGTTLIMEDMTLGTFLRNKPNEVQHKVKYGQPGTIMIPQFDATVEEVRDLYKALADPIAFPD